MFPCFKITGSILVKILPMNKNLRQFESFHSYC
jgi:hypothetical protein